MCVSKCLKSWSHRSTWSLTADAFDTAAESGLFGLRVNVACLKFFYVFTVWHRSKDKIPNKLYRWWSRSVFTAWKKKNLHLFIIKPHGDANESAGVCRFRFMALLLCWQFYRVYSPAKQNLILQPVPLMISWFHIWKRNKKLAYIVIILPEVYK